jgi:hypothetical protein
MALAGGRLPDHSTMAACVASTNAEIRSLVGEMLLRGAEPHLCGGTHVSGDGVKRSSNAANAWRGTVVD